MAAGTIINLTASQVLSLKSGALQPGSEGSGYNFLAENENNDVEETSLDRSTTSTYHQEAIYLYFVAITGLLLNLLVVIFLLVRRSMRKLTSAFFIHACFLDFLKAAYCIPIANNLITQQKPSDCEFFGKTYVLIITASVFNMVAMVCTEAYTFGEVNIGGDSRGSVCCILFGIVLVYIASTILHLGPTLIGGNFGFKPQIGSCSFILGEQTGYVAHVMWITILSFAIVGVFHFICKLYKEIQRNQVNRISMLVRSSITIMDDPMTSVCNVRSMIVDSSHRARIFILSTVTFIICWYPLFLLIVIDVHFKVSPKVYQAFSFIAWTQGTIQPLIHICFDRNINLLARYVYCDKYREYMLANNAANLTNPKVVSSTDQMSEHSTADKEPGDSDVESNPNNEMSLSGESINGTGSHEPSPPLIISNTTFENVQSSNPGSSNYVNVES
ncbi:hypothetical protein KUTeg_010377 [Tegillarca granosa]|uniref:G-protein coupled receptors family 1 profile domain-containing protein n=1 Tax=Tegillarca granosa TaxID=220873 RepID=A0ABQ9F6R4_TEGGR|nr:hypothetical protein KUTeg_010377 [Tegillarca granosa]